MSSSPSGCDFVTSLILNQVKLNHLHRNNYHALVTCIVLLCPSSAIKMSQFVKVITTEDGRVHSRFDPISIAGSIGNQPSALEL